MAIKNKGESVITFPPFIVKFIYEFRKVTLIGNEIDLFANTIDELMRLWQKGHVDEYGNPLNEKPQFKKKKMTKNIILTILTSLTFFNFLEASANENNNNQSVKQNQQERIFEIQDSILAIKQFCRAEFHSNTRQIYGHILCENISMKRLLKNDLSKNQMQSYIQFLDKRLNVADALDKGAISVDDSQMIIKIAQKQLVKDLSNR